MSLLPKGGLYAITDSKLLPADRLLASVEQALEGGLSLLQYRDKLLPPQERLTQACALQTLCAAYQVPLLINDDVELARACGAAGVHLGQGDSHIASARRILGPEAIIGITCHDDIELAKEAQEAGASYVAFGRFFTSKTKPQARPAPLEILYKAQTELSIPLVAIGGIRVDNAQQVIDAGADFIAVIHELFASTYIKQQAQKLSQLFD